jgi:hypothetical protein
MEKLSPDDPMNFTFYDDQFRTMYAKEDRLAKSIGFFSLIAIISKTVLSPEFSAVKLFPPQIQP